MAPILRSPTGSGCDQAAIFNPRVTLVEIAPNQANGNGNGKEQAGPDPAPIPACEHSIAGNAASGAVNVNAAKRRRDAGEGESMDDVCWRVASSARMLRAKDGRFYAEVPVENRYEIYGLKSSAFREGGVSRTIKSYAPSAESS